MTVKIESFGLMMHVSDNYKQANVIVSPTPPFKVGLF